jgi:hypothetical protein
LFINRENTPEDYIGDSWRNVLSLHLKAIHKKKFEEAKDDHKNLRNFVLESFKAVVDYKKNISTKDPKDVIKDTLNHITININVPSASGHNIVDKLSVEDLIK